MAEISISSTGIEDVIAVITEYFHNIKVIKAGSTSVTISGKRNILDKIEVMIKAFIYTPIIQETIPPELDEPCKSCEMSSCLGCYEGF